MRSSHANRLGTAPDPPARTVRGPLRRPTDAVPGPQPSAAASTPAHAPVDRSTNGYSDGPMISVQLHPVTSSGAGGTAAHSPPRLTCLPPPGEREVLGV